MKEQKIISFGEKYANKISSLIQDKPYIEFIPNLPHGAVSDLFGNSYALLFPILWE